MHQGHPPLERRPVKRDLVSVKRDPISVKRGLVSVKRNLLSVKRDLFGPVADHSVGLLIIARGTCREATEFPYWKRDGPENLCIWFAHKSTTNL